jgi:hypothetical protein
MEFLKGIFMKKKLVYIGSFLIIITTSLCDAVFQVAVPRRLVEEKAALVLVMRDEKGELSVGKCRLDQTLQGNVIAQKDLEIISSDSAENITTMELLPEVNTIEQIVVYFELNAQIKVIRVMVIKECFLDVNPFDVVSFNVEDEAAFEGLYHEMNEVELDSLSALTEAINKSDLSSLGQPSNGHWFEQYVAYAKFFALMQYQNMTKAVRKASSWWN